MAKNQKLPILRKTLFIATISFSDVNSSSDSSWFTYVTYYLYRAGVFRKLTFDP